MKIILIVFNKKNRRVKVCRTEAGEGYYCLNDEQIDEMMAKLHLKRTSNFVFRCPENNREAKWMIRDLRIAYRKRTCKECGKKVFNQQIIKYRNKENKIVYYCQKCYNGKFFSCHNCGRSALRKLAKKDYRGDLICTVCQRNCVSCPICHKLVSSDDMFLTTRTTRICPTCFHKKYARCYHCEKVIKKIAKHLHVSGRYYCKNCMPLLNIYEYHQKDKFGEEIGRRMWNNAELSRYKFGVEIEKEDGRVGKTINAKNLLEKTGWVVERDGSLSNVCGFEAVSPVLPLDANFSATVNASLRSVQRIIGAVYSSNCGGHIHISDTKRTPEELIIDIKGYVPLLHAMYPKRIERHYALAKIHGDYIKEKNSHCQAFNVNSKTLELRIFPTPKSVAVLKYRLELIRFMLDNISYSLDQTLNQIAERKELYKILSKVYTDEQILKKMRDAVWYAIEYKEVSRLFRTEAPKLFEIGIKKQQKTKASVEDEANETHPKRHKKYIF